MAKTYIEIKSIIEAAIGSGELKPGDRVGPLRTLCNEHNASLVTIDRALRSLAEDGVLIRKPQSGFFVSETPIAQKGMIHVFVSTISSMTSFPELVGGVEQVARSRGYQVSLCCTDSDVDRCIQAARAAVLQKSRGVVFAPAGHGVDFDRNAEAIRILKEGGVSVVTAGHCSLNDIGFVPGVSSDHEKAAYALTNHLIKLGRKRIAILGPTPNQDHQAVYRGYERALIDAGFKVRERMVHFYQPGGSAELEVKHLFYLREKPDAILVLGDAVAAEAMVGLEELGLSVPDDVSVVGFGDFPICRFMKIPLTTIRVRLREIGQLAAGMLLDLIEGTEEEGQRIELPCDLVVRESCGSGRDFLNSKTEKVLSGV